jgi:hypothetical protein
MQMRVKNFLPGGLTISQKQIDAFTLNSATTHCGSQPMSDPEHLGTLIFGHIREVSGMTIWYYQHVPGRNRLDVHNSRAQIIAMDHSNLEFTR